MRDRGSLIGLAVVELDAAGLPLTLQGVQVRRTSGGFECKAPTFRHPDGRWLPAVMLPEEVTRAISAAVLAEVGA